MLASVATRLVLPAGGAYSTASCQGQASCSPAECAVNSESDCPFSLPTPDWQASMDLLSCKTCTPSTLRNCTTLAATLKVAGDHIKAAWCNDEFMVIAADGLPQHNADTYLQGVPLPPGGDTVCRVRTAGSQLNVYKVPLNPTKLASGTNTVPNAMPNVPEMVAAGAIGVAIDGCPIFPNYNNRGQYAWVSCEVDKCNAHSGRGEDYHYHGDPFGPDCLYSEDDYGSSPATVHPPIIGFSLDGYNIYGRHTQATQIGQNIALDRCGGHDHGAYGYHYHPEVEQATTTELDGTTVSGTVSYNAYKVAPMECWSGDISQIANFWTTSQSQANYDSTRDGLSSRNDLEQLRPCCGMTDYYAVSGLTVGGSSPQTTVASSGTCTYGTCGSGNDNAGNPCPPDYGNGRPDCPRGCTAVPATGCGDTGTTTTTTLASTTAATSGGSGGGYQWTTENTNSYMCPTDLNTAGRTFACGQNDYDPQGGAVGTPTASLACDSGTIECFTFASLGSVGGRCSNGDPFLEDPSRNWAFLPAAAAAGCLNAASCDLTMANGQVNGQALSYQNAVPSGAAKGKFVVLCSTTLTTSTVTAAMGATTTTSTVATGAATTTSAPVTTTPGASTKVFTGNMLMTVDDAATFTSDQRVSAALSQAILAATPALQGATIEVLSVQQASAGSPVTVQYRISTASASVTAATIEASATTLATEINQALATAGVAVSVQGAVTVETPTVSQAGTTTTVTVEPSTSAVGRSSVIALYFAMALRCLMIIQRC